MHLIRQIPDGKAATFNSKLYCLFRLIIWIHKDCSLQTEAIQPSLTFGSAYWGQMLK